LQFIKPETVLPGTYKSDKPKVIGVKPIIVCMTLTGDRPWCLSECCKRYFKRFIKPAGYEYKWLVLDNGQEAFNPKGCEYVRRPVGDTFQAGVRTGILHAQSLGADYIVIMEDDDWYSPQRLVKHIAAFEAGAQLHGYTNSIYYNVKERLWNQHHNHKHSSFHDMAFTRGFSNEILTNIIQPDGEQPFIDLVIWSKYVGTSGVVLDANCKNAISLKAMPGRKGILGGSGHTIPDKEKPAYHADPEGDKLAELIGIEDAKLILDKMLVDRIAELEKLVPTNKVPMVQSAKQRGRPKKVALVTQEQPQTVIPIDSRPMAPIPADAGAPIMDVKSQTITGPSVPVTYNLAGKDSRDPESQRTVMLPEVMLRGFNIHKFEGNILGGKK
jgi:hypothetical protein